MTKKGEIIYKIKDGRWEGRYIAGRCASGRAKYRSVYAWSYLEVKAKRQNPILKMAEMDYINQPRAGIGRFVAKTWIKDSSHKWKESTKCRYQEKLNIYIIPHFGDRELSDISTTEVEAFISMIHIDATDVRFLTCLFTGIRIGELCAINCDNIDLENKVIRIKATMQRLPDQSGGNKKTKIVIDKPKSECSIRDIPINKVLLEVLRSFYKTGAFLLTGERDKFVEPKTMENRFKSILKKCGLNPVGVHTTRHTFASRCIELGMDPKTLSEILGHASVATTLNTYVHSNKKSKEDGINMLSHLFSV